MDFAGGTINLEGTGVCARHLRRPCIRGEAARSRPLLFACGAAVLFRRDIFDADGRMGRGETFADHEDVESVGGCGCWGTKSGWRPYRGRLPQTSWDVRRGEPGPAGAPWSATRCGCLYTDLSAPDALERVLPAALLLAS